MDTKTTIGVYNCTGTLRGKGDKSTCYIDWLRISKERVRTVSLVYTVYSCRNVYIRAGHCGLGDTVRSSSDPTTNQSPSSVCCFWFLIFSDEFSCRFSQLEHTRFSLYFPQRFAISGLFFRFFLPYRTMGRRLRGAALRAKKRSTLAAQEHLEATAQETEKKQVTEKKDEELFVLDTTAILPSKKQLEKKEKKKRKHTPSAKEQLQIQKLVETHSANKLRELAKTQTSRRARIKGSVKPNFDLWGDEEEKIPNKRSKPEVGPGIGSTLAGIKPSKHLEIVSGRALAAPGASKVNIDVAKSGQSYNPDRVEHTKVLHEALQVEKKRDIAEKEKNAPISTGMSAETRAFLLGDSDTDDSSDEEDTNTRKEERPIEKKKEKLTRAQRNKQKRLRAEQFEIESRKRQKKLQNSVAEAKAIAKKLKREQSDQKKKKERIKKLKEETERVKGKNVYQQMAEENPIHAPTFPVALSSDLKISGGSLRTLKPKGSLVTDRMTSFLDRDMAPKKQLKIRKRVEGKRRKIKVKVRGKGFEATKEGAILG